MSSSFFIKINFMSGLIISVYVSFLIIKIDWKKICFNIWKEIMVVGASYMSEGLNTEFSWLIASHDDCANLLQKF